ncbi:hypothetical protein BGZ98_009109 [Dissophora globulifera]|nr:hypothetical protein BGZ98_009109 [Dissophora globulifera]
MEPQDSPLSLPEIRHLVGQYLENDDLLSLILVCRAFHTDFVPFLWRTFVFDPQIQRTLSKEAFHKHEHSIRSLKLHDHATFARHWQSTDCRNLRSLEILPNHVSFPRPARVKEYRQAAAYAEAASTGSTAQPEDDAEQAGDRVIDLIQQQRNLTTLKLNWIAFHPGSIHHLALQLYQTPNRLVTLHLSKWTMRLLDLNMVVKSSPCLDEFFARGLVVEPSSPLPASDSSLQQRDQPVLNFGHIRRLRFHHLLICIAPLLIDCPSAQSIQLTGYGIQSGTTQNFARRRGHSWNCPNLERFHYTGQVDEAETVDKYSEQGPLSDILRTSSSPTTLSQPILDLTPVTTASVDRRPGLKRIALACCFEIGRTGSGLWAIAQSLHGMTLESIDLSYSAGLTSLDILSIFSTCPRLRQLKGSEDYLWGTDVQDSTSEPWTCLDLERLQIRFGLARTREISHAGYGRRLHAPVADAEQGQVDAMYNRLAGLKHLKVLDLSGYGSMDHLTRGIPLTLERGLDRLAGLTELNTIHVTGWEAEMGVPEANWIAKHWPRLQTIYTLHNKNDGEWMRFHGLWREAQDRVRKETTSTL